MEQGPPSPGTSPEAEHANPQSNDASCELHDIKHWEGRG